MQTYKNMQDELLSRLQVAANSTLFTTTRIKELLTDSYSWASGMYSWAELMRAKATATNANHEYYDYPDELRTGSIIRLTVDSLSYKRKSFEDYLQYKEDNLTTVKKMFANYGRQFFINPTPTVSGLANMIVWGIIQAPALSGDNDLPIFAKFDDSGNEAVVKKAFAVGIRRNDPNLADKEEQAALNILAIIYKKQKDREQRDQRLDHPFFDVSDMFATRGRANIGQFSVEPVE